MTRDFFPPLDEAEINLKRKFVASRSVFGMKSGMLIDGMEGRTEDGEILSAQKW